MEAGVQSPTERKLARQQATARRQADRAAKQRAETRQRWQERIDQVMRAPTLRVDKTLSDKGLSDRTLWLIFAVVELEEQSALSGRSVSCESSWFDRVAPPALKKGQTYEDVYRRGVSGFTARYAAKVPEFLRLSRNGYVWPEDAAIELVVALRQLHPQLLPTEGRPHGPRPVPALDMTLPDMRWRAWRE